MARKEIRSGEAEVAGEVDHKREETRVAVAEEEEAVAVATEVEEAVATKVVEEV